MVGSLVCSGSGRTNRVPSRAGMRAPIVFGVYLRSIPWKVCPPVGLRCGTDRGILRALTRREVLWRGRCLDGWTSRSGLSWAVGDRGVVDRFGNKAGFLAGPDVSTRRSFVGIRDSEEKKWASFVAEVQMLAALRHPNVCLFMGACVTPPNRAIVTELVSRGSLWQALRNPVLPLVSLVLLVGRKASL